MEDLSTQSKGVWASRRGKLWEGKYTGGKNEWKLRVILVNFVYADSSQFRLFISCDKGCFPPPDAGEGRGPTFTKGI